MIHYCRGCGEEVSLDSVFYPYCDDPECYEESDYEPGDEKDYDPLEDHEIGWDDVHDGLDPWGYER
jgi:hypothetical protein